MSNQVHSDHLLTVQRLSWLFGANLWLTRQTLCVVCACRSLLQMPPHLRATAKTCLAHPYLHAIDNPRLVKTPVTQVMVSMPRVLLVQHIQPG